MEPVIELASAFLAQVDRGETQDEHGPDYYHDPRAIEIVRIIERDLGVHQVQVLGGGSFGVAAATAEHGGDVIKLTTDASEVESATVLTGTPLDGYPRNVVHVRGAWYLRKLRVVSESWFDPTKKQYHYSKHRIGLLRMERVHGLDNFEYGFEMEGLANYAAFVKQANKVWAYQTRKLSRAAARERFLRAGVQLEGMLMEVWRERKQPVARDIASAIAQLRALGIYGTDFHGGNVGWVPDLSGHQARVPHATEGVPEPAPRIFKVFDIGMSSAGAHAPKPAEIPGDARGRAGKRLVEEAYHPPIASQVKVAELG